MEQCCCGDLEGTVGLCSCGALKRIGEDGRGWGGERVEEGRELGGEEGLGMEERRREEGRGRSDGDVWSNLCV